MGFGGDVVKIGVYTLLWAARFGKEEMWVLDRAKEIGFDGVEVLLLEPMLESLPLAGLKRAASTLGIEYTCAAGLDAATNVVSPDPEIRAHGLEYIKRAVDLTAELGSDVLCGVLYAPWAVLTGQRRTADEWRRSVDCLRVIGDYAGKQGITIALEPVNRYEGYFIATAQEGVQLLREVDSPWIKLHLDTFQMNIEEPSLYEAIKTAGPDLYHFHVCASHRGVPGEDHVGWDDVFRALREVDYDRWLVVESFAPDNPEIARKVSIWRDLAPSSDAIAVGGLSLLRKAFPR